MGVYRITRIQAAHITDQPVNRPKDFELADCWEELFAALMAGRNQYQATVHVHRSILPRVRGSGRLAASGQDCSLPSTSAEWNTVVLRFDTAEEACEYLLAFGPQVEVVAPLALREMIYTLALATATRHEPTTVQAPV